MRKEEVIIRISNELDKMYGETIAQEDTRIMLERILYDYDISPKETAIVPLNDIQDKIMLYLASKKIEGLSTITLKNYSRTLGKFMYFINKDVSDITTMDIRIYLANYSKTGVKNSTIATITDILRGFFSWLENEEYITRNPVKKIKTIKEDSRLREPLTYEELEILRTGCKTPRQKALLEFFYSSCARLDEVVKVNISDINFNELKLNVIGKGNKERTVYINARAKIHILNYLKSRDDDCEALFVTERKEYRRLGRRGIQKGIG